MAGLSGRTWSLLSAGTCRLSSSGSGLARRYIHETTVDFHPFTACMVLKQESDLRGISFTVDPRCLEKYLRVDQDTLLKKQKEKSAILMRRYNTCRYFQCRTRLPPGHKTAPRQLIHKQTVMWIKSIYLAVAVERFVAECCLHTVQFSSKWYLYARKSPYALHPVSQKFPGCCPDQ